jgi:hypothetical protein
MDPLKTVPASPCACGTPKNTPPAETASPLRVLGLGLFSLGAWLLLYSQLRPLSRFLTYDLFALAADSRLGASLEFFLYDTPKVLLLLVLVVYGVGVIRTFFTPARTRKILAGRSESVGNVLAALLGIVTPFCSCSAVPLFIGFVAAGVPLGVTFSFLIAAPMVNEIALILLYGLLGWKVAALYLLTGLMVAMAAGWIIGRLNMENHIEEWVRALRAADAAIPEEHLSWTDRLMRGRQAVREIVGKVWPFVMAGIAVGAGIHGYVPEGALAAIMGKGAWWSVPAAVLLGVPMYANAAGIVPVIHALLEKGAALGTVLAFMMSVIALSLPETVILRKVLRPRLIGVFIGVVAAGIMLVGYLFNLVI